MDLHSFMSPAARRALGAALVALALSGCGTLGLGQGEPPADGAAAETVGPADDLAGPRIPYEVTIAGVADDDLRGALEEASRLRSMKDDPPASVLALRRRVDEDADRLQRLLRSRGHYGGTVTTAVATETQPVRVTLTVEPGPVYVLTEFTVEYVDPVPRDGAPVPRTMADLDIDMGDPAVAADVLAAVNRVTELLRQRGYPFGTALGQKARVDHEARSMQVTVQADSGPAAQFGGTAFSGMDSVEAGYLRDQIPWKEGAPFDQRQIQEMRRTLLDTGLFTTVSVKPAETVGPGDGLPIEVAVEEADHRSIGVGARYSSSLGLGGSVFWEHRNLMGRDEDFRAELDLAEQAQTLGATFAKPTFLGRQGQFLRAGAEIAEEEFEAYDRTGATVETSVERRLSPTWTASVGTGVEYALITDSDGEHRSTLWGFPLRAWRDATKDKLDPRTGSRLDFAVTPYVGTYDDPVAFVRNRAEASFYQPLTDDRWTVLAGRVAIGTIVGSDRDNIPPDKRFYAGGGGSVRGYGYQLATDLNDVNDPIGGKSLLEVGLELRRQVTETIGIVPFIEGGRAFSGQMPTFDGDLFWGAGVGVRYFSPVGPVRFDVAVPLERRDNVDDPFQIYISLGQAF
ncbi:autotransporter assembly complex protein TamA [Novispirillum sp. DQ9]|uniref:autotransporter assembly complex protein TamA n=1 Tax=Novispirillum sp. DQ9 TaxID=3398612 RepID=UPI003C7DD613